MPESVNEGGQWTETRPVYEMRKESKCHENCTTKRRCGKSEKKENGLKGVKIHDREESEVDF